MLLSRTEYEYKMSVCYSYLQILWSAQNLYIHCSIQWESPINGIVWVVEPRTPKTSAFVFLVLLSLYYRVEQGHVNILTKSFLLKFSSNEKL